MAEKDLEAATTQQGTMPRRSTTQNVEGPFHMLERFADEMDRVFHDFGFGRSWLRPRYGRGVLSSPWRSEGAVWMPDVEVFHRANELVVRADLPGLSRDDITVDVTEHGITIQGERKREHEETREGVYKSERSYGSFSRTIAVPEGAMTDQAKATFKDGVLEITMPAPPEQVSRGRRLDIAEGGTARK